MINDSQISLSFGFPRSYTIFTPIFLSFLMKRDANTYIKCSLMDIISVIYFHFVIKWAHSSFFLSNCCPFNSVSLNFSPELGRITHKGHHVGFGGLFRAD